MVLYDFEKVATEEGFHTLTKAILIKCSIRRLEINAKSWSFHLIANEMNIKCKVSVVTASQTQIQESFSFFRFEAAAA